MPINHNIEVSVFCYEDADRLKEYAVNDDGDGERTNTKRVQRYIEWTTGKRFAVAVEVLKSFNFYDCPYVKIECCLDGGSVHTGYMSRQHVASSPLTGDRQSWFHSASRFVDGQWKQCAFIFGDLVKSENEQITDDEVEHAVETYGTIAVSLTLGTLVPAVAFPSTDLGVPDLETAEWRIVERAHIVHTVKHIAVGECGPPMIKSSFTPATASPANPAFEAPPEFLSVRTRTPAPIQQESNMVLVKREDTVNDGEVFQRAAAPEPEQLPALPARSTARERQRRLDQLRLNEIALEKEEIQIRRRMIEDKE